MNEKPTAGYIKRLADQMAVDGLTDAQWHEARVKLFDAIDALAAPAGIIFKGVDDTLEVMRSKAATPPSKERLPNALRAVTRQQPVAFALHYPDGRPCTLVWSGNDEKRAEDMVTQHNLTRTPLVPAESTRVADPWPKLAKPARVGGGTFGVGVSSRLVVEAAQRQHDYAQQESARTPEQAREYERNRRKAWDLLNGALDGVSWRGAAT